MVIGYHVETTKDDSELERMLDNLRFLCTTPSGFNEQRYNYYKEQLLAEYSSENFKDDIVDEPIKGESTTPIVSPQTILFGGPKDTPWPMKCHDVRHTSQSPYSTADNPYIEKWRFRCDWMEAGIVIDDDGTIYFGDFDDYLYALYPDGTLKWKYDTGGRVWSAPAINEDGTIYIGSWVNRLYAINPNGTLKWEFYAGDTVVSSPAIADDGTIYFGIMGPGYNTGRIFAVNPDGTEKWHYDTSYWIVSNPAIGDDGTIYIGSGDSYLYAMYPNGTLRWRFNTGDIVKSHPSIDDDGTIYFDSFDGYLYALYPNGTIKWKRSCGSGCSSVAIGEDDTLYFGSDGTVNKFYAIYPNNGTTKWTFRFDGDKYISHASPAISADGTIYLGVMRAYSDDGYIYAVNSDGTEKWHKYIARYWVQSSPSIAEDGTVYIGSTYDMARGYLHAFGPVESNEPPEAPTISGETIGKIGIEYWYGFYAVDPDNNPISYYVDWDDGTSGWIGTRASGELCYFSHTWTTQGDYTIKAKVKDVMGGESDWATFEVKIERKSREVQQMLFYRLLERFPLLKEVISRIINPLR